MSSRNIAFRPRARLLLQLGDQLIRDENIALSELVKNSYDADASRCEVSCVNIDSAENGKIIVRDDGVGMTPDVVTNVWLEPGADFKQKILEKGEQAAFDFDFTRTKRIPIGEKGVGRFGAHKLGTRVELVTKSSTSLKEVRIFIDWALFEEQKYLDEASIVVEEREPEVFIDGTGTQLTITGLKSTWTKKKYRDLQDAIVSLTSPFDSDDSFHASLTLSLKSKEKEASWKDNEVSISDIYEAALWEAECTIRGGEITSFNLKFNPREEMNVSPRRITLEDISKTNQHLLTRETAAGETVFNIDDEPIGGIKIHAYIYDLDRDTLSFIPISQALQAYLKKNGGVRVYRDGLRIYDYGEQGNDWLDLDKRRINNPSKQVGNRNILGSVLLSRVHSRGLIEKTNREGFVDNDAYKLFSEAVKYAIDLISTKRLQDKEEMREVRESKVHKKSPVIEVIEELKVNINDALLDVDFDNKEQFLKTWGKDLEDIQDRFIQTSNILMNSANMGLSFGVVVHEVEKRLKRLKKAVDGESIDVENLREQVDSIAQIIEGYSAVTATDRKKSSVKKAISISLMNVEFRFEAHGIELISAYEAGKDTDASLAMNSVVGVLLNIFDNSIYWLNKYKVDKPKIYVALRDYGDKVGILIADNGKGLSIPFEDAIKPFITDKTIGGHGLGLHIVDETMKAHKGVFVQRAFPEVEDLPSDFSEGAIVELIFDKVK